MVNVEVLRDAEGRESYRVSRVFPNTASAERAAKELERINPQGFTSEAVEPAPAERLALVLDEDEMPPGCPSGLCGMD